MARQSCLVEIAWKVDEGTASIAALICFFFFFSCHLSNVLFSRVLILSCFVLSFLDFKFVYVLLKICLIVLYMIYCAIGLFRLVLFRGLPNKHV